MAGATGDEKQQQKKMVLIFVLRLLLLSTTFRLGAAILHPVDFLALQSIRTSLQDLPGSTFFSTWDFTADPCATFSGVFCSGDRVVSLSLGDTRAGAAGLSGRLHTSLGRLSALSDLSLVPGRVTGPIPPSLSALTGLRFLALSGNLLYGGIPPLLSVLRHLHTLDLSHNALSGAIPPSFSRFTVLTNLVLSHNRLSGPIPSFSGELIRLDLKNNALSGEVGSLPPSLRYLSLSFNQLSGPIHRFATGLVRLNYLDLSMNRFSGAIPGVIFSFQITNLQLQRNQFVGPVWPAGRVTARVVDLSYNQLTGTVPPALAEAEELYLNNNMFTGAVPTAVVRRLLSGGIRVLYLQHNYLRGSGLGPDDAVPVRSSLCLLYNCMVPPAQMTCPAKAGKLRIRPAAQCR